MYDGISEVPPDATEAEAKKFDRREYDDLREAHAALDAVVENVYGVDFDRDEERIVDHLFNLYARMTEGDE